MNIGVVEKEKDLKIGAGEKEGDKNIETFESRKEISAEACKKEKQLETEAVQNVTGSIEKNITNCVETNVTGCVETTEEREFRMRCETDLPGVEVEKRFRFAARSLQRSEAAAAFYLAEIDDRRIWRELGYSSVIAYASAVVGFAMKKTYALLNIGRRLRELPVLRTAFDENLVSWTKVRELVRLRGSFDEEKMLERARASSSRDLEQFISESNDATRRLKRAAIAKLERMQEGLFDDNDNMLPEFDSVPAGSQDLSGPDGSTGIPEPNRLQAGDKNLSGRRGTEGPAAGNSSTQAGSPGSTISVTMKFTPEEYAIYKETRRIWKHKNRPAWKQERMVISFAGRFLEDVARASFPQTVESSDKEISGASFVDTTENPTSEAVESSTARVAGSPSDEEEGSPTARVAGPPSDKAAGEQVAVPNIDKATTVKLHPHTTGQSVEIDGCEAGGSENCGAGSGDKRGKRGKRDRPVLDSPLNLYISLCPKCERVTMPGKFGDRIDVHRSMMERALCDGAVHEIDEHGMPGRKKRSVSPALRKKIFMRDGGVCRVTGCGATSFLEVHHVKPLSKNGGNDPSNLILTCGLCHKNIHERRLLVNGSHPDFDFLHMGKIDMINQRLTKMKSI